MEINQLTQVIPPCLVSFSLRAVVLLAVPFVLCFVAWTIRLRLAFLQFGCFLVGFLLASCVPLPNVTFSNPGHGFFAFVCCYVLVLMMIVHLPRIMVKDRDSRRQVAVIIVLFLVAAFVLHWLSSRQLVL